MKIEHGGMEALGRNRVESARLPEEARPAREASQPRTHESRDRAAVSERARLVAAARAEFERVSQVREARVEELRRALEAGTYQVPVAALADRLTRLLSGK